MNIKQTAHCFALMMLGVPAMLSFSQEIPVTTSSKEAKKLFLQGRDKIENAESIQAYELLDKAIELDPNFAMAYLLRSQSGGPAARQQRQKAISLINKVSAGEKYTILLTQSNVEENEGQRKECMEQLLKNYPKDKRVHLWNGFYLNALQKFDEAIVSFNKAIEIDKNFGPALNNLGQSHMRNKNWKKSESAFKRYAEVLPNSPGPLHSYAEMLMKSGRFDDAIINFKKAVAIDPAFINAYSGMGLSYIFKGDFVNARECFKQQLAMAPSYNWKSIALRNYMISYLHEGLPLEALRQGNEMQALASKENNEMSVINLYGVMGWINLDNNNLIEASKNFEQARVMTEESYLGATATEYNRLNRMLERVHVLIHVKEYDLAEALLTGCKKVIDERSNPDELSGYYVSLGILERSRENYDEALNAFSKASADDAFGIYQKALTLEKTGDREGAKKAYEEVVNWNWYGGIWYAFARNKAKQKLSVVIASGN